MADTLRLIYHRLGSMEGEAKLTNTKLTSLEKTTTQRFESLEKTTNDRFGSLEAKMDERFESLETKMDERFESLETKMDERFESLEKTMVKGFRIVKSQLDFVRGAGVERHLDLDSRVKKLEKTVFGPEEPAR